MATINGKTKRQSASHGRHNGKRAAKACQISGKNPGTRIAYDYSINR
jgi:hypothetical protein